MADWIVDILNLARGSGSVHLTGSSGDRNQQLRELRREDLSENRLYKVLKTNRGKYFIDEDGGVHTNWKSKEVQEDMKRLFEQLKTIKVEK